MASFQQYVEGTAVNKVHRPASPPGYFIEFVRDNKGIVTHFIEHTATVAFPPTPYSRYHPLMMTQTDDWQEFKLPEAKPEVKVVDRRFTSKSK